MCMRLFSGGLKPDCRHSHKFRRRRTKRLFARRVSLDSNGEMAYNACAAPFLQFRTRQQLLTENLARTKSGSDQAQLASDLAGGRRDRQPEQLVADPPAAKGVIVPRSVVRPDHCGTEQRCSTSSLGLESIGAATGQKGRRARTSRRTALEPA